MQSRNFHYFIFQEKAKGGMDDSAFESLEKDFKEVTIVNTILSFNWLNEQKMSYKTSFLLTYVFMTCEWNYFFDQWSIKCLTCTLKLNVLQYHFL